MQFMKHLVAAAALTVAGSAMAITPTATYDVGALTIGEPDSLTFDVAAGSFNDVITFSVSAGSSAQVNAKTFKLGVYKTLIQGLTLSVYDSHGTKLVADAADVYTLASGSGYSFLVSGSSTAAALYSVNYQLTALPAVPEPGSVAMMLAGLGVVGVMAARRRRV